AFPSQACSSIFEVNQLRSGIRFEHRPLLPRDKSMSRLLSKDEEAFKTKARNFAEDHVIPQANEVEAGKYPRELIRDMGRENLLGAPFSKSDGGQGLGWVSEVIVAEEVSAANAGTESSRAPSTTLSSD